MYSHLLCNVCIQKPQKERCYTCKKKYNSAKSKQNRKRKSCAVENKENSVNKTIIGTNTQSGSDIGGNIGSDDSGLGNTFLTILMLVIHYD